jgi:hypothetical protein
VFVGHSASAEQSSQRPRTQPSGKTDTIGAEAAARSVLASTSTVTPKTCDGVAEMIRQIKIARDTARKGRTSAITHPQGHHRQRPRRVADPSRIDRSRETVAPGSVPAMSSMPPPRPTMLGGRWRDDGLISTQRSQP